ncbi:MAG TPA: ParB N-terminal domain-containing protein, partial [Candidatus Paceibacterota bacterium]
MGRGDIGNKKPKEAVMLDNDVLLPDPHQPRTYFDAEALEELGLSIKHGGQRQALTVSPAKDKPGFFYITHGESRWRSGKKKGIKKSLCIIDYDNVYDGTLNVSRVLGQTVENVQRRGHRHSELVRVMSLVYHEEKEKGSKGAGERADSRFAGELGMSIQWAQNYRTLTNLHPDLLKLIDMKGSGLSFMMAVELARNDQDVQHLILEEARKKNTTGQAGTLFKHIGHISRRYRIKSGRRVRTPRAGERSAAYFSFFKKIANARDHLVGSLNEEEFLKLEAECIAHGSNDRVQQALLQVKELTAFLEGRAASLKKFLKA